ncbi:pirin family protein [Nonomuraea sp. NPDC004354]
MTSTRPSSPAPGTRPSVSPFPRLHRQRSRPGGRRAAGRGGAGDRFATTDDWLESRRSFSFGPHDDPADVGFGFLLAHNDETLPPGTGFATHPHQDLEIVT